jgi:hypothetical protein
MGMPSKGLTFGGLFVHFINFSKIKGKLLIRIDGSHTGSCMKKWLLVTTVEMGVSPDMVK